MLLRNQASSYQRYGSNSTRPQSVGYRRQLAERFPKRYTAAAEYLETAINYGGIDQAKAAASEVNLLKIVKQMPDIRPEVVEKAKQDIESGRLFSQDIAEKTAEEILRRI